MKSAVIIFSILTFSFLGFAQDELNGVSLRIGYSIEEINEEAPSSELKFTEAGEKYLYQDAVYCFVYYFLDKYDHCKSQLYVYNGGVFEDFQKIFSTTEYIKLDSMEYLRVEQERVLKFSLSLNDELLTMFVETI